MKVKLPLLSAREMVPKGSTIQLEDNGGVIANARTGQSIHFMIHDDLWYMKLKVKAPDTSQSPSDLMHLKCSPFWRAGEPMINRKTIMCIMCPLSQFIPNAVPDEDVGWAELSRAPI